MLVAGYVDVIAAIGLTLMIVVAGCGSHREKPAGLAVVVASTDVWGSVAQAVAGRAHGQAARDVQARRSARKRLRHPAVGWLDLDCEAGPAT